MNRRTAKIRTAQHSQDSKVQGFTHISPPLAPVLTEVIPISPPPPVILRSILTLFFHLLLFLPSFLFHSASRTIIAYALIIHIGATWPAQLILLDMITVMTFLKNANYEAPIFITIIVIPPKLIRDYSVFALSIM